MKKIVTWLLVLTMSLSCSIFSFAGEKESEEETLSTLDLILEKLTSLEAQNNELQKKIETLESENEALRNGATQEEEADVTIETEAETEALTEAETETENLVYTDKVTIQIVQSTLGTMGYDCGTPDGVAGNKTRTAIEKYQTDNGLPVDGQVTTILLESLGVEDKISAAAELEAKKAEYSSEYSYEALERNPNSYKGEKKQFTGRVLQVMEEYDPPYGSIRILVDGTNEDVIYVYYTPADLDFRILENDNITVYGEMDGIYTYSTTNHYSVSIPFLMADFVILN